MYRSGGLQIAPERPFNMAVLFLERINVRCNEKDVMSENGNMIGFYRSLRAIYRNIVFKLSEEDIKVLSDLFLKAEGLLSSDGRNNQIAAINITTAEKQLDKVDIELTKLMFKYDLIFPRNDPLDIVKQVRSNYD